MTAAWLILAGAMAAFLFLKLQLSFDMSAFFPTSAGPQAEVLLQQLSSGPGSRMMVVGINGAAHEDRVETGRLLVETLQSEPSFVAAFNGEANLDATAIPEPLASGYPLMADMDLGRDNLEATLQQRLADMSFGGGRSLRSLIARDPFLVTLELLARLGPGGNSDRGVSDQPWVAGDGSAVIAAQTHAAGTDLVAQAVAVKAIEDAFEALKTHPSLALTITGVGAFGIQLQSIIQKESQLLGILAGSAIMLVLLVVYRSFRLALLAAIPLGLGYLAGVTAVALAFETVHGITLAFGFTLLGVTVDYPLHLFSHARQEGGRSAIRSIWPTLRLGAASTATAYLAMVFSGAQGLSQLGVFTAVGVVVAVLVTRTLLPAFLTATTQAGPDTATRQHRGHMPALVGLVVAIAAIVTLAGAPYWNDAMDTLSPVPRDLLQTDQELRSATATADMRYQVSVESDGLEDLLAKSEQIDDRLQVAVDDGFLAGWSSITALMPSQATQERRLEAIPEATRFSEDLSAAIAQTSFTESAFAPFEHIVTSTADRFPITPASFDETPLAAWRDAHLLNLSGKWVSLYTLGQPDAAALSQQVETWGEGVRWIDLRAASGDLMRDFRHDAATSVAVAALVILALLLVQRVGVNRLAWIALTVSAALAVSVCAVLLVQGYLTLVHMVALLLVLGLGLDYALFFSRSESATARRATVQSILACSASTTLAFGILATSSIPLLRFIGLTVACGSLASLLFAWLGSRKGFS